jgi:hypothetical protein
VVTVADRTGGDALQVAAGARLGEPMPVRSSPVASRREVGGALLLGAVLGDHPAGERVAADGAGDAHPPARDLLEGERERDRVDIEAAVLLGDGEPEQAHRLHRVDDLGRVAVGLLPLPGDRTDLLVDEVTQGVAVQRLLVAQGEVHGASSGRGR